jgi:hypothetical protein
MTEQPAETARPAETQQVAEVIESLYAALGDRTAFDRHLDPAITIWESDAESMLTGTADLDRLRDERATRAATTGPPSSVAPQQLICDMWGDSAVARYVLRATYANAADSCFRVTDVLRRGSAGWQIVHHHSESLG